MHDNVFSEEEKYLLPSSFIYNSSANIAFLHIKLAVRLLTPLCHVKPKTLGCELNDA